MQGIGNIAALAGVGVGGWALGMYAGNWPHRAIHSAIEGRPEAGPTPQDPPTYEQHKSDGMYAALMGTGQLVAAGGLGATAYFALRNSHPTLARLGAVAGAGAAVGVFWELMAALGEADAEHPGRHVDFPAFL